MCSLYFFKSRLVSKPYMHNLHPLRLKLAWNSPEILLKAHSSILHACCSHMAFKRAVALKNIPVDYISLPSAVEKQLLHLRILNAWRCSSTWSLITLSNSHHGKPRNDSEKFKRKQWRKISPLIDCFMVSYFGVDRKEHTKPHSNNTAEGGVTANWCEEATSALNGVKSVKVN